MCFLFVVGRDCADAGDNIVHSTEGAVIVDVGDAGDDEDNALMEVGVELDFLFCTRRRIHICFLGQSCRTSALIPWRTSSTGAFRMRFTAFATLGSLRSFAVPLPAMFVTC